MFRFHSYIRIVCSWLLSVYCSFGFWTIRSYGGEMKIMRQHNVMLCWNKISVWGLTLFLSFVCIPMLIYVSTGWDCVEIRDGVKSYSFLFSSNFQSSWTTSYESDIEYVSRSFRFKRMMYCVHWSLCLNVSRYSFRVSSIEGTWTKRVESCCVSYTGFWLSVDTF